METEEKKEIPFIYRFICIVTFIGTIAHELSHLLMCYLTRTRIKKYGLVLFKVPRYYKEPAGSVYCDYPKSYAKRFLITIAPLYTLSFLGITSYLLFLKTGSYISVFFLWLGFSISYHALPSTSDCKGINKEFEAITLGDISYPDRKILITIPVVIFIDLFYYAGYKLGNILGYDDYRVIYSLFLFLIALVIGTFW